MTEQEALALKKKYPWYKPARIFLSSCGEEDVALALHYMSFPPVQVREVTAADFRKYENELVINDFLACKNVHIVPVDQIPEEDLSEAAGHDEELVSEELAEIYLAQGHKDTAKTIYGKLSLLYPEKSVYFAELIENINKNNE